MQALLSFEKYETTNYDGLQDVCCMRRYSPVEKSQHKKHENDPLETTVPCLFSTCFLYLLDVSVCLSVCLALSLFFPSLSFILSISVLFLLFLFYLVCVSGFLSINLSFLVFQISFFPHSHFFLLMGCKMTSNLLPSQGAQIAEQSRASVLQILYFGRRPGFESPMLCIFSASF